MKNGMFEVGDRVVANHKVYNGINRGDTGKVSAAFEDGNFNVILDKSREEKVFGHPPSSTYCWWELAPPDPDQSRTVVEIHNSPPPTAKLDHPCRSCTRPNSTETVCWWCECPNP